MSLIFFPPNTTDGADRYSSASRIAGEISPRRSVRKLISDDLFGLHLFASHRDAVAGEWTRGIANPLGAAHLYV